ncbi:hypothetical protein ACLB2K_016572 [Fragaria x ananassa]
MRTIAAPMKAAFKPHNIEVLVLWLGMKFSRQIGVTKLAIASDAVNVINAIGRNELDLRDLRGIMDAVRKIKVEFESLKYVRKRHNKVAYTLARNALMMVQSMFCYEFRPLWLM